tara:strand:+ start:2441 stop:2827 length:387 start_codon:yes stop_codon:yes gene_type:complete
MTKVVATAKTLDEGVKNMMAGAKEDYKQMSTSYGRKELTGYSKDQYEKWDTLTRVSAGKKFIKIVQENGVFAFIVKEDDGKFRKGDILKPAGYNAPAKNSARGNVLDGNYYINWTGPLYMDSQSRLRG